MATPQDNDPRAKLTYADRYPETAGTVIWCAGLFCGEDARAEDLDWWQSCADCRAWWAANPPPGEPAKGEDA